MRSFHPLEKQIPTYWNIFITNVDPIIKLLHVPYYERLISDASRDLDHISKPTELFMHSIVRPLKLLLLSPVVLALSTFCAFVFGLTFLLFTTFPIVFEEQYGFSSGVSGLSYLGLGTGMFLGLGLFSVLSDRLMKKKSRGGEMKAEYRLAPMVYFTPIIPIGFFWYGWSAQAHVHVRIIMFLKFFG